MTTNAIDTIREALTEANEAMMWELGGEPLPSLPAASRLKIEEALSALDGLAQPQVKVPDNTVLAPRDLINALAHHGVDTGYGIYQIERKHIQEARELLSTQEAD